MKNSYNQAQKNDLTSRLSRTDKGARSRASLFSLHLHIHSCDAKLTLRRVSSVKDTHDLDGLSIRPADETENLQAPKLAPSTHDEMD